ncbi:MAG: HIT domain-containing protein [Minisyncoccia bacterium]|jgi:UDPglucose--hexose-1-phosphate uridylyltransferase
MSEFREDPVSGDWTIIAPGRAKRPEELFTRREPREISPKRGCPFEDLKKSGNWPPIALYPDEAHWKIAIIRNKYPALAHGASCAMDVSRGLYHVKTGVGDHEIVITRDHRKNFSELTAREACDVFMAIRERYRAIAKDACSAYISAFFNWGREAGASLSHPHYQILALPIIPPHATKSFHGALRYFKRHGRCVRCDIVAEERKEKTRIVAENRHAVAFVPYAAKRPFEVTILPRRHAPYFTLTSDAVLRDTARLLQSVMRRMKKYLHDPDLNFFIHDAPVDGRKYPHHHWHIEVVPVDVISPPGGFEISTIVNINVIPPDAAAAVLRGKKIRSSL